MRVIRAGRGYPSGPFRVSCSPSGRFADEPGIGAGRAEEAEAVRGVCDTPAGLPGVGGWYVAEVTLTQGWELWPTDQDKEVRPR